MVFNKRILYLFFATFFVYSNDVEEVIVTAEKRDESLQSVSQAVTAITDSEIDAKNIRV